MQKTLKSEKILVVAPHPDDESLGCGGMMLQYAEQTDSFCFISSGIDPDGKKKSEVRISEWNAAQKFIGCTNLGITELYGEKPLLPRIKENIPQYLSTLNTKKYDRIFMPQPNDNHPEHKYISNKLMREIIYKNGYKKGAKIFFYEVWTIILAPNYFVEIDPLRKKELLALYKTQWGICNLPEKILGLNCYRGIDAGFKRYAEAFETVSVENYLKITEPTWFRKRLNSLLK